MATLTVRQLKDALASMNDDALVFVRPPGFYNVENPATHVDNRTTYTDGTRTSQGIGHPEGEQWDQCVVIDFDLAADQPPSPVDGAVLTVLLQKLEAGRKLTDDEAGTLDMLLRAANAWHWRAVREGRGMG